MGISVPDVFGTAGMKIYQLDSATRDADTNETIVKDPEAYDLTMWLESGVFEAVELKWVVIRCNRDHP